MGKAAAQRHDRGRDVTAEDGHFLTGVKRSEVQILSARPPKRMSGAVSASPVTSHSACLRMYEDVAPGLRPRRLGNGWPLASRRYTGSRASWW